MSTKWSGQPLVLVCGAISSESGVVHLLIKEATKTVRGLRGPDIVKVLEAIRVQLPKKKVAVFLDNASIHRA